ncbi:MAG: Transglutaminase-like superfamily protein [Syntrophorhabdus sp. PtaB.Bin047]|jgi:transglutaminase-like putative cysteine protease|nr:MAG: Transglutaminase-like superfamily protein [Syntrophorhabdus sp. PtaB.Bin047]
MGEMDIYLRATEIIDSDNDVIRRTAARLVRGLTGEAPRAQALFSFVRDEIHYNVYMLSTFREDFRASIVLERGKGYCVQKAVLLAALARSAGIPSRLAFARIRNHRIPEEYRLQTGIDEFPSHGYTQLFVNGRWMSVTPAFDRGLCERLGVPACDFDGENDAILAPVDLAGNPYVEYIEKYEPHADLPFEWLHGRIFPIWGNKHPWADENASRGHVMPLSGYRFP